jgi:hypothetical protein
LSPYACHGLPSWSTQSRILDMGWFTRWSLECGLDDADGPALRAARTRAQPRGFAGQHLFISNILLFLSRQMAHSKTSTWWRSGDESSADPNLEAYFKGLKSSVCRVCGVRVTSTCNYCGGRFCSEHVTNHSCERLLPSDSPGDVTEIGRSSRL